MSLQTAIGSALLFFVFFCCDQGNARLAPDFIHPCNDTSSACLIKATQDAIPEFVKGLPNLGIPVLDPFTVEKLTIPLNGLTFTFYNGTVTGFRNCIVDDVVSELEKRHFVLALHGDLTITGTYDAKGRFLVFPIDVEGDVIVNLTNLRIKIDIKTKYIKDNQGVNHLSVKSYKYSFSFGNRVSLELGNFFKDNKELSRTAHEFLNREREQVAVVFGKPILDYGLELIIRTVEKFFFAVPYEELINVPIPN